eukprot:scaffold20183_cov52-Phaeocystis_antarctica.AAC.5
MHLPGGDPNPNPYQVETMITVDVHQRDCYDELVQKKIREPDHFDWQKQARRRYWMHTPTPTTGCLCLLLTLTLLLPLTLTLTKARFYWMHDDERAQICVADVPFWYMETYL